MLALSTFTASVPRILSRFLHKQITQRQGLRPWVIGLAEWNILPGQALSPAGDHAILQPGYFSGTKAGYCLI